MKKIILTIISAIVLLSQTACVIRYKLPDNIGENSESSESDHDVPVICTDVSRTVGDYVIKNVSGSGVEIIRYIGDDADVAVPKELDGFPVVSIGTAAFADLENLQSITVPDSVETIRNDAFSNCRELLKADLPDSVTEIGKRAFADCVKLKSFRIPEKIRTVEEYTFHNCYVIEEITLPEGITSIEKGAFFNCAKLTGVTLPDKIRSIEIDAFYSCFELKSIKLPDSLEHLGKKAFEGCFRLEEIFFKGSVYTVYIGDDDYDHTELLLAVNGEIEEDDNDDE